MLDSKVDSLIQDHSIHPNRGGGGGREMGGRGPQRSITKEQRSPHPHPRKKKVIAAVSQPNFCGPLERRGESCHSTSQSASLGIQQNRQYHTHESPSLLITGHSITANCYTCSHTLPAPRVHALNCYTCPQPPEYMHLIATPVPSPQSTCT